MNKSNGYIAHLSNCNHLVCDIASKANLSILPLHIQRFSSGEIIARMSSEDFHTKEGDISFQRLFILGNIHNIVNDNIMEILSIIDLAKNIGFKDISLVIPYMGYSRQDRMFGSYSSIGLRILANMINQARVKNLITIDIHSKYSLLNFLDCNLINIPPFEILIANNFPFKDYHIIAPDEGSYERLSAMHIHNNGFSTINKTRSPEGVRMELNQNFEGKKCLIIDDIIDSGATIREAIKVARKSGASQIIVYATHILNYLYQDVDIYGSNSIYSDNMHKVLDIRGLIVDRINVIVQNY